jgi:Fe-S cluster assembly protein SufD
MAETAVETEKRQEAYLENFRERAGARRQREPGWLAEQRQQAIDAFADLGFPAAHDEEWRYTNVTPITRVPFQAARPASIHCAVELVEATYWRQSVAARLVFINGHYSPQFSVLSNAARGLEVGSLAGLLTDRRPEANGYLRTYLGRSSDVRRHAFTALNAALWEDGALVRIPKGLAAAEPIHLVFVSAAGDEPLVSYPRTLVIAERDAQATVIESYVGMESGVCFSNAVSEFILAENARVDHYRLQRENARSFHVGMLQAVLGRSAQFSSHSVSFGGALVRNDVNAVLDDEGADCTLNGLYVGKGKQHVDNHTAIEHARPHGASRQLYHGILDDAATAVFNGRIVVHPNAQKTDAVQKNRNLLLSADAAIDTKPELVIFADDVRCTHGATIGQMDPEALFYLRSRGVGERQARELLIHAFAAEIVDHMKPPAVRDWTESALRSLLS